MRIVHYCGSKSILPFGIKIDDGVIKNGLQIEDKEVSAIALKKLISMEVNVPIDHLKLYAGKELVVLEEDAKVEPSTQLYFTIITCKNPEHCPSQVKIVTLFGQFRAPFTRQTTVKQLKAFVQKTMGIEIAQQRYKFRGQILQDDDILSQKQVIDGSELRLDPKTRGS